MDVPEITRCFGTFPPKYATYMISIFSLAMGGLGLAGIIIYALVRELIVKHFTGTLTTDPTIQKVVVLALGLSSLFLFFSGLFLLLGVVFSQQGSLFAGVYVLTIMCAVLIVVAMAVPIVCYEDERFCLLKKLPLSGIVLVYLLVTVYIQMWLYFMVVAHNHLDNM